MTSRRSSRWLFVLAVGAVVGSWRIARRDDNGFDTWGDRWRRPRGNTVDVVTAITTDIGSVYGLVGTAVGLAAAGHGRRGRDVFGAGALAWIAAQAAKPLRCRPRPYEADLGELLVHAPAGSSWPSGHTAVAAAVATTLAGTGAVTTGALAAGWVGWSRIYVGAHHPSDISAGAGVGVLSALAWRTARNRLSADRQR